jgi:hypothetical protein
MKKIIVVFVIVCWLVCRRSTRISLETNVTKAMAFQMKPRNRYCFLRWDWWMVYSFAKRGFKTQNLLLGQGKCGLVELDYPRRAHKRRKLKQNEELQMAFNSRVQPLYWQMLRPKRVKLILKALEVPVM